MDKCLFCRIVSGEIPSSKVYEDDRILAFYDIAPMARVHVLVIPKQHIASAQDISDDNSADVAYIFAKIPEIAKICGIDQSGYRVITNCGSDACQSVMHLHYHILGGQQLKADMA